MTREYTSKIDKLEQAEQERQKDTENAEVKPMILPEPQLMLTAGPGMGIPPQYVAGAQYAAAPGYIPQAYQGYGM